jgi:multidrug efflux pump subunit AcrA (membrane-fusion protein)
MIRKYALPVLAGIGVLLVIFYVLADGGSQPDTPPAGQSVGQAANVPFPTYIFGPGIVEASTENIAVGTPVSGIVTAIYVKWGDHVRRAAPLFKIDTRDLEAQLLPAAARIKEIEAQLAPANAKVSEAEAVLAKTENRLQAGEALEAGVSISAEELANRRLDVSAAKANLAAAQGQIGQIQAQIESARAQAAQIRSEIERRTVRAPVAGRILQMKTRLGEYAQSGVLSTPLMVVGDDSSLHIRVDIDENDAWKFQPCAQAVASVRGNPALKTSLRYVRTDPDVIPKVLLTGDATQRTDTRVLQVVFSFDPASLPVYVGQLMDVFIDAPSQDSNGAREQVRGKPCSDASAPQPRSASGRKQ